MDQDILSTFTDPGFWEKIFKEWEEVMWEKYGVEISAEDWSELLEE